MSREVGTRQIILSINVQRPEGNIAQAILDTLQGAYKQVSKESKEPVLDIVVSNIIEVTGYTEVTHIVLADVIYQVVKSRIVSMN